MMNYVSIVGLAAGILTNISFIPQIYQIYRTKETRDLSLPMFIILTVGIFLWLVYGVLSKSMPVIVANTVAFISCSYIVIAKIKYG